jgi:hypothetical protein
VSRSSIPIHDMPNGLGSCIETCADSESDSRHFPEPQYVASFVCIRLEGSFPVMEAAVAQAAAVTVMDSQCLGPLSDLGDVDSD